MKTLKSIALAAALLCGLSTAQAQTNTPPTFTGALSTAANWVSTINTNYSWADVILWDGAVYANQINVANELGGSADLFHSVNEPNNMNGCLFDALEARARQAGIAGTFVSEQGGDELGWMKGDLRVFGFADFVYLEQPQVLNAPCREAYEFGLQAEKMLSTSTAMALFVSKQEHQKSPFIGVNFTVTFGTIGGLLKNMGL